MTASDPGPVVQRILIGAELRDARDSAGMSSAEASKALKWYSGKLSKIELGDMKLSDADLTKAVKLYGIADDRVDELRDLAAQARRKLPPSRVPEFAARYVNLERAASELSMFFCDAVPGIVQTRDYARAALSPAVTFSPAEVERMSEDRQRRADRLRDPGAPRLRLIVGEEAFLRQIGGKDVLRAQLEQLRSLADLPNVSLQAIPFRGGAHSSHGVGYTIISLIEGRYGLVYIEGLTGSDYLGREHSRVYTLAFDTLRASALSPQDTINLIDQQINTL